jgi:hypothetical protein
LVLGVTREFVWALAMTAQFQQSRCPFMMQVFQIREEKRAACVSTVSIVCRSMSKSNPVRARADLIGMIAA